ADHVDHVERSLLATPLRRAAAPEDISDVIAFLALGTTLMTGQVVVVDGGRTMRGCNATRCEPLLAMTDLRAHPPFLPAHLAAPRAATATPHAFLLRFA